MAAVLRFACATVFRHGMVSVSGIKSASHLPIVTRTQVQLDYSLTSQRNTSFFVKLTADQLWKGCTSVSNAGRKRGRGRGAGRKMIKNLNKGQIIGIGKSNMVWPGLNAPVLRGKEIVERRQLPPDTEREERLIKMRDEMTRFRRLRLTPLERGWSGNKMPGRSVGPPDPIGEDNFQGFDTKVLELKAVVNMSGNQGRKRRVSAFVVTGNKNGIAGFALSKSVETQSALRKAKNRAGQKLMYVERFEEHTVHHDFYTIFGRTKLFVKRKPKGYGLICHRAIKCMCEMIGITDLHVKLEGRSNIQNLTKAFFLGLLKQKTHQQSADAKGLYVVEFREDRDNYPRVVATPAVCRFEEDIQKGEVVDYNEYITEGKVEYIKPKRPPFYKLLPSWEVHLKKTMLFRNHFDYRIKSIAEHGELTSFILKNGATEDNKTADVQKS